MKRLKPLLWAGIGLFLLLLAVPGPVLAAETSCLQCHGAQSGRFGEPVPLWRQSIHAANGISCHNCHGGDPTVMSMDAMSPERGFRGVPAKTDIPDFCGRCHIGVKEDYLQSAHGKALGKGGPQCVTCHSNHKVVAASPALINPQSCTRCHDYGRAADIKAAVTSTDQMIGGISDDLAGLHHLGIDVKEMQGKLFSLRNEFHRLFHEVDAEKVRQQTADFQQRLGQIRQQVTVIQERLDQRKLVGGGVIALLVLAGVLAALIRKSYHEEERAGE